MEGFGKGMGLRQFCEGQGCPHNRTVGAVMEQTDKAAHGPVAFPGGSGQKPPPAPPGPQHRPQRRREIGRDQRQPAIPALAGPKTDRLGIDAHMVHGNPVGHVDFQGLVTVREGTGAALAAVLSPSATGAAASAGTGALARAGDTRTPLQRMVPAGMRAHQPEQGFIMLEVIAAQADDGLEQQAEAVVFQGLLNHRGRSRSPREPREPPVLEATGIHQVLAWDITLLPGPVKGQFFYLYMVMDVWSRRILGVEVHDRECGELARDFFDRVCRDEGISSGSATILHADNGAPMRSYTLVAKLAELGISLSFSRPRVSNDNAYAESLFRTAKYRPEFPAKGFADLDDARVWAAHFVQWYNVEHRHSGIRYVSPAQRHAGDDHAILAARHDLYLKARERNPARWSGDTRNWTPIGAVTLNPERDSIIKTHLAGDHIQTLAA